MGDLISKETLLEAINNQLVPDGIAESFAGRVLCRMIVTAPAVDAVPVVRCKDCAFFRDRHVLTDDGQRKSYDEMPPEAFGILGDGGVTSTYGINVGSQCLVDCNKGYSDDKTVFRSPDEFCARAMKKEE